MPLSEHETLLSTLRRELEFLESGGYRASSTWRPPMIFEDSPICLRTENASCEGTACPLLRVLSPELRHRQTPCRYISLNDKGETVDSFYKTGTPEELEAALRQWLTTKIRELEG